MLNCTETDPSTAELHENVVTKHRASFTEAKLLKCHCMALPDKPKVKPDKKAGIRHASYLKLSAAENDAAKSLTHTVGSSQKVLRR